MASAAEPPAAIAALVDAALLGDEPEQLVEVAARLLDAPLGLVAAAGRAVARAPRDTRGERALAVAAAAARSGLVEPPGWRILPLCRGGSRLGYVAVGRDDRHALLELVATLLAEQLQRGELRRAEAGAFVRRLLSEPGTGRAGLHRDAAGLGVVLADAYWPAVLSWRNAVPRADVIEAVEREAGKSATGVLAAGTAGGIALLHPASGAGARAWFEHVVWFARRLAPAAGARAVLADGVVDLLGLGASVAELEAISRLAPRADEDAPVLSAHQYALDRLLAGVVEQPAMRAFVTEQLGTLIEWDRAHRGDLLLVLEAALDYPRHEQAANRCYMHRNTFRHRLRHATEVLGHDLEDPDVRLATHVALKLRKAFEPDGPEARAPAPPPPRQRRPAARARPFTRR